MKIWLLPFFTLFIGLHANAQDCVDCNVLVCDGYSCDDGSNADGVQTSRKCGCGDEIQGACAKVVLVLSNHPEYDSNNPSGLKFTTQESGNFNIYFSDDNCAVGDCQSPDIVVEGNANFAVPAGDTLYFMICKNGGNSGRRDMNFEYFPVQPNEVGLCSDELDNDLNGFVDCEDGSCVVECDASGSGEGGGTESNGRMARQLSFRNYSLIKTGHRFDAPKKQHAFSIDEETNRSLELLTYDDVIPANSWNRYDLIEATPDGLIGVTNATDVHAIDIYDSDYRLGSMLILNTVDGVYEHTKYICDRLYGNTLDRVYHLPINNNNFIAYKLTEKGRVPEFGISFTIRISEEENLIIENYWNLDSYQKGEYLNVQLWVSSEDLLIDWMEAILDKLQLTFGFIEIIEAPLPTTFIRSGWIDGENINLEIHHTEKSGLINIHGKYSETEIDAANNQFSNTLQMDSLERLKISYSGFEMFDLGIRLEDENGTGDDLYLADGPWGFDASHVGTSVGVYDVWHDQISVEGYPLRRSVRLAGSYDQTVSLYRALHARFKGVDVSNYNTLSFMGKGSGNLEITLVKSSITNWESQYRTSIKLFQDDVHFDLPLDLFKSSAFSETIDVSDVVMVVFTLINESGEKQVFDIQLSQLNFNNSKSDPRQQTTSESTLMSATPNPVLDVLQLTFVHDQYEYFNLLITDIRGSTILERNDILRVGAQSISVDASAWVSGIYIATLQTDTGSIKTCKILKQ